jgi:hypothetical protein
MRPRILVGMNIWPGDARACHNKYRIQWTVLQNSPQNGLTVEADCERPRFLGRSDRFRCFGSDWWQEAPLPLDREARLRRTRPRALVIQIVFIK